MRWPLDRVWARQLLALVVFLAGWEALARAGLLNPFYAPPPTQVARVLVTVFADGTIWPHLQATFTAALLGLAFGLLIGIVLGFAAALLPFAGLGAGLVQVASRTAVYRTVPRQLIAQVFATQSAIGSTAALRRRRAPPPRRVPRPPTGEGRRRPGRPAAALGGGAGRPIRRA